MNRTPIASRSPRRGGTFRPQLEALEDRLAPVSIAGGPGRSHLAPGFLVAARQRDEADLALLAGIAASSSQGATRTTSDVIAFADGSVRGESTLLRTNQVIGMVLATTGLEPGAYTNWWVVFNNPEACVNGPGHCGEADADFEPGGPAEFGFTWAAGHLVGPSGRGNFASYLEEGVQLWDDDLNPGEVFEDARTAEINLIVRYHGAPQPGHIYEQTHTLQPELGLEADLQFVVHPAP